MYFLFTIIGVSLCFPLDVFAKDDDDHMMDIYTDGKFSRQFNKLQIRAFSSCTPTLSLPMKKSTLTIELFNTKEAHYTIISTIAKPQNQNSVIAAQLEGDYLGQITNIASKRFNIVHTCDDTQAWTASNVWSKMYLDINLDNAESLRIEYQFSCDERFRFFKFDLSLFCMIVLSTSLVAIFSRFGSIYSIMYELKRTESLQFFQGFEIRWYYCIGYTILMGLFGLSSVYYSSSLIDYQIPQMIMLVVALISLTFIINELMALVPIKFKLQRRIICHVRVMDIVSLVVTILILLAYVLTQKAWYINDIISFALIGAAVKLFKITSLKTGTIFLVSALLVDIASGLLVHYTKDVSYDQLVQINFNYPVEIQMPLFTKIYQKKCAWISIMHIILPGLLLGYLFRYDLSKNTRQLSIISFSSLLLGQIIWISVQSVNKHTWPQSLFTYPIMIVPVVLWSLKQKDLKVIWGGEFYDQIYLDPFMIHSHETRQGSMYLGNMIVASEEGVSLHKRLYQGLE